MNVNCAALRSMNRNRLQWGTMREGRETAQQLRKDCLSTAEDFFSHSNLCAFSSPLLILLFFSQCWVLMDRDWDKTDFLSSFIMKDIVYWEPSGAEKRARLSFLFLYVSWFHFISTPLARSSSSSISLRLLVPHKNVLPLSDSFSNHCGGPEFSFIGKKMKISFLWLLFVFACLFQWVRKANKNCRNCS